MYDIIKRNGDRVPFALDKIRIAIDKAMNACGRQRDEDILTTLALRSASMAEKFMQDGAVAVESVQDCVEQVLSESGYFDVARSYILYRDQHKKIREAKNTLLDYQKTIDDYLRALDWRVKESSTVTYSLGGLILSNSGAITANYWLTQVYDDEIAEAHRNVQIHLHDLSMLSAYCAGWNLKDLIERGIISVAGRTASKPAAHLSTLANQMVNFLGILQNEWAGAQAFSSFDTYLAPFVKADNLSYEQVKQAIQSFVFGVNTPSRWGCVDTDTEVLSATGFKKYDELKEGDFIYTWKDGRMELNQVRKVVVKPHKGVLHSYRAGSYHQDVTPDHRVLVKAGSGYVIKHSSEIFGLDEDIILPVRFDHSDSAGVNMSDDEIEAAVRKITADGAPIDDVFLGMDMAQAMTFLREWLIRKGTAEQDGCRFSGDAQRDRLQHIALLAGFCSYVSDGAVRIRPGKDVLVRGLREIPYDGQVWCPNVENGTAVFRKAGCVFISGQCQAPFTNITLDWTCPEDMRDQPAIVGGKEMPFTYGDCEPEMAVVNKAFIEIMLEGDANGRGHQYPIGLVA